MGSSGNTLKGVLQPKESPRGQELFGWKEHVGRTTLHTVLTFTARAHARFQLLEFQHQLLVISMTLYDIAKQHACVLSGSGMEKRGKWHAGETRTIRRDGRRRAGRLWEPGGGGVVIGDGGEARELRGQKAAGSPEEPGMVLSTHRKILSLPWLRLVNSTKPCMAVAAGRPGRCATAPLRSAPPRPVSRRNPPLRSAFPAERRRCHGNPYTVGRDGGGGRCHL